MSSEVFEFRADDGEPYRVLLICRSSCQTDGGGETADDKRLDEQEARLRDWLSRNITGPVEVTAIKLVKEGKSHDSVREQSLNTLQTGGCDLILVSSLDRIARGLDLLQFLKLAARQQTRIIAVADSFDSGYPNWLFAAALAALRYESASADTARRVRRSRRWRHWRCN